MLASADICLSPIHRSPILDVGSPTKLIEYLALGMPVVANDHPEQKVILQASRAGVCVPWGAQYFARAVRWLMRRSPAEREAMGSRGRAWVETNRTYALIAADVERTCIAVLAAVSPGTITQDVRLFRTEARTVIKADRMICSMLLSEKRSRAKALALSPIRLRSDAVA